jgi:hypothetical protein
VETTVPEAGESRSGSGRIERSTEARRPLICDERLESTAEGEA